jgi:hypothetical protein
MNLLTDVAPRSVEIEGQSYAFDADFRNCIKFENLMFDPEIPDDTRAVLALNLFYPVIPQNVPEAFQRILWFYAAGQESEKGQSRGNRQKRIYSLEYDADYIFAAFLADYRIDLNEIDFLHWWKFRALFSGLKPDNLICKIMEYRAADTNRMKGEERKFYQKMQRLYALPVPREEREKCDDIADALMRGGDISEVLHN